MSTYTQILYQVVFGTKEYILFNPLQRCIKSQSFYHRCDCGYWNLTPPVSLYHVTFLQKIYIKCGNRRSPGKCTRKASIIRCTKAKKYIY
jgi:hypothetical protein